MLGSSAATYLTIVTYTGMVYGAIMLLFLHLFSLLSISSLAQLIMDTLLTILLLVAAIIYLLSDYVNNCSVYGYLLRCRSMRTSVVFTFLAMAAFLLSALLDLCGFGKKRPTATAQPVSTPSTTTRDPYHTERTPEAYATHPGSDTKV
uniref:AlNc14C293G10269 protein n=1 Tax=Albugo laibachii Nc14 TaxID=890382 RepID=F0WVC5_9STRA|nr:AlNc14C293G10269 [Albugo laibachii Nc14]|eukprot:CCA25364.1 AlNc14C293G10269 [Albugo laibachii Nc14]